ncbi:MAG: HAMP domain-containing sensor histidine kinase [Bacteroidota bacterium]
MSEKPSNWIQDYLKFLQTIAHDVGLWILEHLRRFPVYRRWLRREWKTGRLIGGVQSQFKNLSNWLKNFRKGGYKQQVQTIKDKVSSTKKEDIHRHLSQIKERGQGLVDTDKISRGAQELKEKASQQKERLSQQASAQLEKMGEVSRPNLTFSKIRNEQTKKGWRSRFMGWLAHHPGLKKAIAAWMDLPIWRAEGLFFKTLFPAISLISLLLIIGTSGHYFFTRNSLKSVEQRVRLRVTEELKTDIQEKYETLVRERANSLSQKVRDKLSKTQIVADAPTFRRLNIQGMESYSRKLFVRDSSLLNVVVLTTKDNKEEIKTRRIGDTTRFIFTCCELPEIREISYQEINEPQWLGEITKRKSGISNIYTNPQNGERYFYAGNDITDLKGKPSGALLLRYNLNFAVKSLGDSLLAGINYLIANDSLLIASSQDSLFPAVTVSGEGSSRKKVEDYVIKVVDLIRGSATQEEAMEKLRKGEFIDDPFKFKRQFRGIFEGDIRDISPEDSSKTEVYRLTAQQANAILNLSFGQLLGLKRSDSQGTRQLDPGRSLAFMQVYLDSIRQLRNGSIMDNGYLLSFHTNEFGWLFINQSFSEDYLKPVVSRDAYLGGMFDKISRHVFWFSLAATLFFLLVFTLVITGIFARLTFPIHSLYQSIAGDKGEGSNKHSVEDEVTELGHSFKEIQKKLSVYVNQLQVSNRNLEEYAYFIAHDLKQPLNSINGFATILKKRNQDSLDEESRELLDRILGGAHRMGSLIEGIMRVASLSNSLNGRERQLVDLNVELSKAIENLSTRIEDTGATLEIDPLPSLILFQEGTSLVFQNILENALKYCKTGEKPLVQVSASEHSEHWQIDISDNGKGVEKGQLKRIFRIYAQADEHNYAKGFGIGLASVKRIMEYNGGSVSAHSDGSGEGATFSLSFPKINQ